MPTDKPRVTFTMSEEMLKRVDDYKFDNRIKNQTQAIVKLIDRGLEVINEQNMPKTVSITSQTKRIPILGSIPAGIPLEAIEDIIDYEEIPLDWTRGGKEYFALQVRGNSMYPRYEEGDVIILRKQDEWESGKDCAVRVDGNEATFKRVKITDDGIILQAINPDYDSYAFSAKDMESVPVKLLGVVVELRRKI